MRLELTYILGATSWCRTFSPHAWHAMDELLIPSGFAERRARQSLVPAPLDFDEVTPKSPPGNPVRPIPTDVPVPDPLDVPVPEPMDVPVPDPKDVPPSEPRDVPPPKSRPGTDPKPRSVP